MLPKTQREVESLTAAAAAHFDRAAHDSQTVLRGPDDMLLALRLDGVWATAG